MGGPNTQKSEGTADWQQQIAQRQAGLSEENYARMLEMEQPLIDRAKKLSSGDPSTVMQAAGAYINPLTTGYNKAKTDIYEAIAPGAARDVSLASLAKEKNTGIAKGMADVTWQAPEQLASLGAGFGAYGLQQLGAGLNASGQASSGYNTVMQAQAAQQKNKMQMWTGLASAAGGMIPGNFAKSMGGGNSSGGGSTDAAGNSFMTLGWH
jgi:hypothetical protein